MILWAQAALSLATGLLTALGALYGVRHSVRGNDRATVQRELAARREEWWRRFTWAAEMSLSDVPAKRVAGLTMLTQLARSELAQREDLLLLDDFHARILDKVVDDRLSEREQ